MDYPEDADDQHPVDEFMYPEIDETAQYPWPSAPSQSHQFAIDPAIDPRLYGLTLSDVDPGPVEDDMDDSALDTAAVGSLSMSQRRLLQERMNVSASSGESEYEPSKGEESSDEEMEDEAQDEEEEEDEDDDAASLRRRRQRRGRGLFSGRYGARGGRGIKRGPRRPLEPSPEFKILHSQATEAFIDGDYDHAIELVKDAILINPEMFAAHSLLSEIFLAQGEKDKAVTALFSGAHTRPKDPTVWSKVAKLLLERSGEDRQAVLNDVVYCYSRVIEIDQRNYHARFQRATIYRELGYNGRAVSEYERILKERPHNIRALRHLAEISIDSDDVQKAIDYYMTSIEYYMSLDSEDMSEFSWSDVNICVELFNYAKRYDEGLKLLKSLARWLLDRKEDHLWESILDDDREWDADHSPRRIKTAGFDPNRYPLDSYGFGLPMELRIKLGAFRLKMGNRYHSEALGHFEWLSPDDTSEGAKVFDYADLFREAADALKEAGLFEEALRYYVPLQLTEDYVDVGFFMAMGDCAFGCERHEEAEAYYLAVVENDTANLNARVNLARLYDVLGMSEQALKYVNEAVILGREETGRRGRRRDHRIEQLAREFRAAGEPAAFRSIAPKVPPEESLPTQTPAFPQAEPDHDAERPLHVQFLYSKMMELRPSMRQGDVDATEDWLDIADALLRDFRSNRVFYPQQRNAVFLGYSREAQRKVGKSQKKTVLDEMHDMASRLQESMGKQPVESLPTAIPHDYYGISFDEWLDIFMEYAFVVSGQGEKEEAYDTLAAAADASVWYHDKHKLRQIHICIITCALRLQDEETLVSEARWFIKEYQFVTDTYRLYAMLSRLCGDPQKSLFHSSANMKFMLRQIKAMDYTLPEDPARPRPKRIRDSIYQERAALSTRNESGEAISAEDMDGALLVLYGHILYTGKSFFPALNYFFRAYALDDQNPAVLLSIALSYIHHSLKRQADNRHYLILQGLAFMHDYRRLRERDNARLSERQEMEFNFARVWHSLGILHLADDAYQRALAVGDMIQAEADAAAAAAAAGDQPAQDRSPGDFVENFSCEAAVALQSIYMQSGDLQTARELTEKYLVI